MIPVFHHPDQVLHDPPLVFRYGQFIGQQATNIGLKPCGSGAIRHRGPVRRALTQPFGKLTSRG